MPTPNLFFAGLPLATTTRIANHNDAYMVMRDFFVAGRRGIVSSLFVTNDGYATATNNFYNKADWQEVGLAACFMN